MSGVLPGARIKTEPEDAVIPAIYVHFLRRIVRIGREHGYAIGVHGSMARDLDLIAVPWVEEAAHYDVLVKAIAFEVTDQTAQLWDQIRRPVMRPHGRMAWAIPVGGGLYVDLSVMPKGEAA